MSLSAAFLGWSRSMFMLPTGKNNVLSAYTSFKLLKTIPVFPWMISHQEQWSKLSCLQLSYCTQGTDPKIHPFWDTKLGFKHAKIIRASLVSVCTWYRRLLGQRSRCTKRESFHASYPHINIIYPGSTRALLVHDLSKGAENRTPKQILDSICPE